MPLAGQYDWVSLGLVAAVTIALFAAGVALFTRRDIGVMTGIPVPGLPRATLGLRGPVGRAFGDQLPQALAWGIGIGVFGLMLAAMSRSFGESLVTDFPTFADMIRAIFPSIDLTSAGWFLQLVFVEMGLIVVGFAAATFVSRWASDEESGRLEMVLSAPLTRQRWTLAGGVGALLAVAVTTAVFALGIAIGAAVSGSEVLTPTVGTVALGLYAAAMVGIGIAVGGLWRTSWAAEIVAAVVIATFLVNLLAPALELPGWVGQLALSAHLGQPMIGIVGLGRHDRPAPSSPWAACSWVPGAWAGGTWRASGVRSVQAISPTGSACATLRPAAAGGRAGPPGPRQGRTAPDITAPAHGWEWGTWGGRTKVGCALDRLVRESPAQIYPVRHQSTARPLPEDPSPSPRVVEQVTRPLRPVARSDPSSRPRHRAFFCPRACAQAPRDVRGASLPRHQYSQGIMRRVRAV